VFTLSLSERNEWLVFERVAVATAMKIPFKGVGIGKQSAECSKSYDTMGEYKETIEDSHPDMGDLKPDWVQYCVLNGAFVFYSEPNYQGQIKYGGPGKSEYINDMEPDGQTVNKVGSIRIMGNLDNWESDSLTLFEEENLGGFTLRELDEDATAVDLTFSPRSAAITGTSYWTVYAGNDCRNILPGDDSGYPRFISNVQNELNFYGNINKAAKGCQCKTDLDNECP